MSGGDERAARILRPGGWAPPRGYSDGMVSHGRYITLAGQIGWDPTSELAKLRPTFAEQFDQALSNVMDVVRSAGGQATDIARMTVYVTDKKEYLAALKQVGEAWRKHLGKHYPAMALVVVAALLEDEAKVEIEATAVLGAGA